ncbi:hypothetical protein ACTZWW_20805 [Salinarimonas sp. NSM]|uniref:hypothetical protein n=1 Tax=Salinarimonas sp. NSM TaxID=3458003 RepID=UPI0040371777
MPLVRALAVVATIFWFSPVREDGAGTAVAPSVPRGAPIAAGTAPAPAPPVETVLDRHSLAGLIAEAGDDAARAQALWQSLPEDARSALARRIADELAGSATD